MAKHKAPYVQTPSVPAKKIAGTNPVGSVELGAPLPGPVPKEPGITRGLGMPKVFHQPKPHGFGHSVRQKHGPHRLSGAAGAHRVGLPKAGKK